VYLTPGLIFSWIFELQIQLRKHNDQLHVQQLLNVVADLCHFILHEAIHVMGYFVHHKHELATEKKTKVFVNGTLSTSLPAAVAFIKGNRIKICILCAI
jgi:hypothetical protein